MATTTQLSGKLISGPYIKSLATNRSADRCTLEWVSGVTSNGTFVKAASTTWSRGVSGIPTGWTVQDAS